MADQSRSIESILAALAQRPTPTPGQQPPAGAGYQQTPPPNAYPPPMPHGAQPTQYTPSAYSLPQPSSSGNLDLSAIKPVNSGTVDIADAIAKAKAFANEKGISSYDISRAPPPAAQYGDARHYRSRSRSPPARRDAFRDNFNPYRDERRDDGRGNARDYGGGHERSMSPGPGRGRSSGTFSPRGSNGRDRGGADDDSETVQIESSLVGLIIGRQGENLRRVESEHGVRVQFITGPDNQGPYRQCRISGPRARRAEARAAIDKIIEDSGMGALARAGLDSSHSGGRGAAAHAPGPATLREGEDCMQIMVPDRTVGLIIGRGGETIRDLQERSGCHINIVGENKSINGLRPVNLIGTPEASAQAKGYIMEIVDSDNRNAANGGGGGGGGVAAKPERHHKNEHGRDHGQGAAVGDKINDSIYVPSDAVGMIIGKGGETIREMQNTTGCKINVSSSTGPGEVEREIGLVGSRDAINRAKRAIEDKVDAVRQKNNGGGGGGGVGGGGRGGRNQNQGRRDYDNPNYSQQSSSNHTQSNAAPGGQPPALANGAADPYAPYGGYQAYVALWYYSQQQALAGGQAGGDMPKPPGA
ncbi:uncharacterized protein BCR38DRAFT_485354 [Pseudomassariella vexata]|uniref:K Homology domain-containing protein n=1 Tax=Pseudomassariella vexata TaxID=1141098 RepID=A0A1Y2DY99_9PEZI|nr:uncharacterized protein BCR38DRAFT_485354 [Pseudomassariella vexata]ORY64217.1 hypothetical protein BCR38DRAFT_485354 [Pseudomassariella vexata]